MTRITAQADGPALAAGRSRGRTFLATMTVAALALASVVVTVGGADTAQAASGSVLTTESFTGASATDPRWIGLGAACLTGATAAPPAGSSNLGVCASTTESPTIGATPGYLQLTDASGGKAGNVLYNRALPSSAGLDIVFDSWQYKSSGTHADGIGFFLTDGSYTLSAAGPAGGSLGYASQGTSKGVAHGYVGVGLDVYGSYSNTVNFGGADCGVTTTASGQTVAVRGPGDGTTGYCMMSSVKTNTVVPSSTLNGSTIDNSLRKVRIVVSPTTAADPYPTVTTYVDFTGTGTDFRQMSSVTMTTPAPATFKFGLSASTGSFTDVHLVRLDSLTTVDPLGAISIVKTVDHSAATGTPATSFTVGDSVPFSFLVTNSSADSYSGIAVNDPLISNVQCPSTTLNPADSMTCTGRYTVTAQDAAAGTFTNTASVSAQGPNGTVGDSTSVDVPTFGPTFTVAKTASAPLVVAGSKQTYSVVVTNTSSIPFTAANPATFTDDLSNVLASATYNNDATGGATVSGSTLSWSGALAAGASTTITYSVTGKAGSATSVTNTVTPGVFGGCATAGSCSVTTPVGHPSMTLTKTASPASISAAGQTVTYSFAMKNTGDVAYDTASVAETAFSGTGALSAISCPKSTIAAGETVTCTATYTVTQKDVDAGTISNTAQATARVTGTGVSTTTSPSTATVSVAGAPKLTIDKKADASAIGTTAKVGDTITYTFTAANAGNVTMTGVAVQDGLAGLSAISYGTWPSGTAGTLAPGQSVTATATYTLTQADIDAGHVANSATASGTSTDGTIVPSDGSSSTDTSITATPVLTFSKKADATAVGSPAKVGDVITYTFTAANAGNVTMTGVAVQDGLAGLSAIDYAWPGAAGTLAPGQSVTATATYTLTQADIDAGHVKNSADATGTAPGGKDVSSPSDETDTAVAANAVLTFTKKDDVTKVGDPAKVGDVITYTFTASNAGNATVSGVTVVDGLPGLSTIAYTWPGAAGVLVPGQTVTATATYTLTQADLDAGVVKNSAVATGTAPNGSGVTSPEGKTDSTLPAKPELSFDKKADASAIGTTAKVGDTITYTFTASNSGTVTMTGVAVQDGLVGLSAISYGAWPSGTAGTLAPGQSVTATATYTLTQADIDAGHVANSAAATGTAPGGGGSTSDSSTTDTAITASPLLTFDKKADGSAIGKAAAVGDTITYTFTAHNAGNVTATGVAIEDGMAGLSAIDYAWPGVAGTLAPGQTVTATATYALTQADIDAGVVKNSAVATGTAPDGSGITSEESSTTTDAPAHPELTFAKKADDSALGDPARAGDTITYTFTTSNTGNVTMTGVAVEDGLDGLSAIDYAWPGAAGTLAPGQSVTATATYKLTQADVDAGHVANTATATGTAPDGSGTTSGSSGTDTGIVARPLLTFDKKADASAVSSPAKVGETITYTFTVENAGNTTTTGVTVEDGLAGLSAIDYAWPGADGVLAPGEKVVATATYQLTQADIDAGHVANTASATGTAPDRSGVTSESSGTDTAVVANPALSFTKKADESAVHTPAKAGERITYSFTVTNSGNTTMSGIQVVDGLAGLSAIVYTWPGAEGVLAPGETMTATASYGITSADILAGHIENTATATGTTPGGAELSSNADKVDSKLVAPGDPIVPGGVDPSGPTVETGGASVDNGPMLAVFAGILGLGVLASVVAAGLWLRRRNQH